MTQTNILNELIREFKAHIEGQSWEEEFILDGGDSKAILDALICFQNKQKDAPMLNVEIDGVRFVPVDSLAKDEGK